MNLFAAKCLTTATVLSLFGAALVAGPASAGPHHHPRSELRWARVVEVTPIDVYQTEPILSRECRIESHYETAGHGYYRRPRHAHSAPILGAIVGGVIGNQFGSGSGRAAATFAGAVLGDAIARDRVYANAHVPPPMRLVEREVCEDVPTGHYRRTRYVDGYDVAYEYGGEIHHTRTDYHPGERIRIEVSVRPAY